MERASATLAVTRISLGFGSLLLSVALLSFLHGAAAFFFVFRIAMTFALRVALLYLPIVIKLKDAEEGRIWKLLGSGVLIGPAALVILDLILEMAGGNAVTIWRGDGIGLGVDQCVVWR